MTTGDGWGLPGWPAHQHASHDCPVRLLQRAGAAAWASMGLMVLTTDIQAAVLIRVMMCSKGQIPLIKNTR